MSEQAEKRKNEDENFDESESSLDSEDESSNEEANDEDMNEEEIETEFEAYPPLEADQEGIKALLKQLFKKEPIELGLLADHLIEQKNLCIVVKQLIDEQLDEEDEDVFSLTSLIQLDKLADKPFVKLINKYLIRTAKENGNKKIVQVLENGKLSKALVFNERFINLPSKLGIMSLENLMEEVKKENLKISHYFFICKLLKAKNELLNKQEKRKRLKKADDETDLIYTNEEDQILSDNALESYEFKIVDDNSDLTVQKNWKSGQKFVPYRRVLLLDQKGVNNSLKKFKEQSQAS